MTNTPELTPLQRWSQLIRTRAEARVTRIRPDQPLAEALRNYVATRLLRMRYHDEANSLDQATVESWLAGTAVPKSEVIHEALLTVLNWPPLVAQQVIAQTPRERALAMAQAELDALSEDGSSIDSQSAAPHTIKPPAQEVREIYAALPKLHEKGLEALTNRNHTIARVVPNTPSHQFSDSPFLERREIAHTSDYDRLAVTGCTEKMSETSNVHEYLRLYRGHRAEKLEDLAHRLGINEGRLAGLESGEIFPDRTDLAAYGKLMNPIEYKGLENVAVAGCIRIYKGLTQQQDPNAVDILEHLPAIYWQNAMAKKNTPSEFRKGAKQILWVNHILPIDLKEQYVRAARGSMGLSVVDVSEQASIKADVIIGLETGRIDPKSKDAKILSVWYRDHAPSFDLGVYDGLDTAYKAEAAAKLKPAKPKTTHVAREEANKFLAPGWPFKG